MHAVIGFEKAWKEEVMKKLLGLMFLTAAGISFASAHNGYTGGYSGSPGATGTCASSCHGGTSGTLVATGFPTAYIPGQTYTVTFTHNGGNKIVNVNATTRLGTTSVIAGTFIAGTNSAVYTGTDGGIYASPHLVDNVVFQWKAPAVTSGPVKFYAAAFQAASTSSTSGGQSSTVTLTATESAATAVTETPAVPREFTLSQNFPNPFNPSTMLRFTLPETGVTTLKVYNIQGEEVATLFHGTAEAGSIVQATFHAGSMASGIYFARLEYNGKRLVQKMLLMK
jgi:hypothetical protein